MNTSLQTVWLKVSYSYENSSGSSFTATSYYKYADYVDSDGTTYVTDTSDERIWTISIPVSYIGKDDSVVQNWTVTSKEKNSKDCEIVEISIENVKDDGSLDITIARSQAILEDIELSGEVTYEPYSLISFSSDNQSSTVGECIYITAVTTPDVSKIRISFTNAETGKKKSNTYQTSSTNVTDYSASSDCTVT